MINNNRERSSYPLLKIGAIGIVALALLSGQFLLAQEAITLNVWKGPHSEGDQAFFDEKLADCTADMPNVTALYRVVPWATLEETLTAAFASGEPADITYFPNSFFPKYADAGLLLDLSTIEGADLAAWEGLFDPSFWAGGQYEGVQYGLPILQGGISFFWNKTLFREAGLDPDTPPATWEELLEFAQMLTIRDDAGNVTQWGYSIIDNTTGIMLNYVPVAIVNYGGELTNEDNSEWVANTPGHVEGLQFQVDLIHEYEVTPPFGTFVGEATDQAFADGKIAMQLNYASFLQPLLADKPDFELGVSMPPAGPVNDFSLGGIGYWTISAATQHPVEAWALAQCLAGPEIMSEYTVLTGLFPARNDINPYEGDPLMQAVAETQRNYMRLPILPFDYWPVFMAEAEAALAGQKSAQQALDDAAAQINELIANTQSS